MNVDADLSRRDVLLAGAALIPGTQGAPAALAASPLDDGIPSAARSFSSMITVFIRYQIDPFQREAFRSYAENWGRIIPRCGGHLIGYFLPHEGSNDIAWGLIAFENLAQYEAYRARLRADAEGCENFAMAESKRLILREERTFTQIVPGAFAIPPRPEPR